MSVSVYITSYNQRDYLIEAIDSVLNQSRPADQIIIVDDASTDDSKEIIQEYKKNHPELIDCILHETNTGVSQSRVDALGAVRCKYVTYLDGDDRYLPDKIKLEYEAFSNDETIDIVFSNNVYVDQEAQKVVSRWVENHKIPEGNIFEYIFSRELPKKSLYRMEMVNYEKWKKIGFHDTSLKVYEDYDMRIRLSKSMKVKYVNRILTQIRRHKTGLSQSSIFLQLDSLEYIFTKNLHLLDDLDLPTRKRLIQRYVLWYRFNCLVGMGRQIKNLKAEQLPGILNRYDAFKLKALSECA